MSDMEKKVYFAGSIRGGRVDAALYRRMIEHIKKTAEVLTEHVGDLALSALEGELDRDRLIYEQDTAWIRECDLLIAECTCPSLGVLNKPCFVFYNRERGNLSAMIKGDPYYELFPYSTEDEIVKGLDSILK